MKKQEFIENVASLVIAENEYRKNPLFNSVVIAMACLETGFGKSSLMIKANAIFGIKATKAWKGKVYNSKTKECYDGVTNVTIDACFRAYESFADSILKIIKSNKLEQFDRKEKEPVKKEDYIIGKTYTLQVNLNVRIGAGTSYKNKKYSELTKDGRKHALNISNAVLKRGTKVTCLKVIKVKDETWLEIPSGFICAKYGEKVYVK